MDNGPARELPGSGGLPDAVSYCVDCGNVMVYQTGRDCPACHVNDRVDDIADELERVTEDVDDATDLLAVLVDDPGIESDTGVDL